MVKELKIRLNEITADAIHVFKVEGSLGIEGSAGIQGLLDACLKEHVFRIILDLEEVTFISSAGMGAFLSAVGELRKNGGDMVFVRMQDKISNVFRNLDVLDYFVTAGDVEGAVALFRDGNLPRPLSLKELTAAAAEKAFVEESGTVRAIFALLAGFADILDDDAELSYKISQLVDITANYLALAQCAFVPLREIPGVATASARPEFPAAPEATRRALAAALLSKDFLTADQFPVLKKETAAWLGASGARFLFPLTIEGSPVAVLAVGDKKDGGVISPDERRVLRYLRTALKLALMSHMESLREGPAPETQKLYERKLMELETLFAVAQELAEALEIDRMLPTFLMMATGQFSTDRAAVLFESRPGQYTVRAQRGLEPSQTEKLIIAVPSIILQLRGAAAPLDVSVLSMMVPESERPRLSAFSDAGLLTFAPLRFQDRLLGIACLGPKISGRELEPDERRLFGALSNLAAVSVETARLVEKFKQTFTGVVRALVTAVEAKDAFTRGHTERVTRYAALLSVELGLDPETHQNLLFGAVLHDVGYIGVPEEVLRMPDGITSEQLAELRRHPIIGSNILKDLAVLSNSVDAVRYHHEHYDGSGYPDGLVGEEIPIIARIIAVCDAFDAMTSERRYREAKTREEAAEEIRRHAGTQFDPAVAKAFLNLIESHKLDIIKTKE